MLLVEAVGITKSYPGVRALKGVSFDLKPCEVHALAGENGAGKSTLVKIITGAVEASEGTLRIQGTEIRNPTPSAMKALGVAAIYQQPSLFPHLTVAENIAMSLEPPSSLRRVDWRQRHKQAKELLDRVGASINPDAAAADLTMPEQQLVEIAKAVGASAKILIMDEPTASLTDREVDSLFRVIASLTASGSGIIYITHRLEELNQIANRVTVLRDGESVGTLVGQNEANDLVRLMVGRELSAVYPNYETNPTDPVLELKAVGCEATGVRNVSLSVRSGEIFGFAGLVGAGRTELANVLFGLTPADSGEIKIKGATASIDSPTEAIRNGIGYVPEDRRQHGLVSGMSITQNTTLAILDRVSSNGLIDDAREEALSREFADKLGTKAANLEVTAGTLSGGNQQKVVLSRWLATNPSILILDEPTQGIDVGAKAGVHKLIGEMASRGMAILLMSSELPEVLGMSNRIAVMSGGTIAAVLDKHEATQERIMHLALGKGSATL